MKVRVVEAVNVMPPTDYDTMMAIRALRAGVANEGQQRKALDWILYSASGLHSQSWRLPSEGGNSATDFHEGRRFVGLAIEELLSERTLSEVNEWREKQAKLKENPPKRWVRPKTD